MSDLLQTEVEFTLPRGYDDDGTLQCDGTMRLATAADEIHPLKDPRVQANPSYLTVILLSRVITRLGTLPEVTPHVVENLFVADIAHLQDLYERINARGANAVDAVCPACSEQFTVTVDDGSPPSQTAPGETARQTTTGEAAIQTPSGETGVQTAPGGAVTQTADEDVTTQSHPGSAGAPSSGANDPPAESSPFGPVASPGDGSGTDGDSEGNPWE